MTEHTEKFWELYLKEKQGSIGNEEQTQLNLWKNDNPKASHEFDEIFNATHPKDLHEKFDPKKDWKELQTLINIHEASNGTWNIKLFPWIARAAAAIIVILGLIYVFYWSQRIPAGDLNLQTIVRTDGSNQKVVELSDGTKVWMNRDSELLHPETFDGDTRTIYLNGEAFFEVAPDQKKPFVVRSGISKTTVLGTSFNLRAYSKEDDVRLTVVTGKVAFTLADDKEGVIVTPGNMAVLNNKTMSITPSRNTDANFLSWKTNHLTFDDRPIHELIKSLERHYNIQISVRNPETMNCRFTGDFGETSLENVIKIITRATGTSYEVTEGQYVITGAGCN